MQIHERMEKLTGKIAEQCRQIDGKSMARFLDELASARRIFVAGAGRSGLVARAFAMRLMHLGLSVHVVGEVTTPGAKAGDLLIIVSGSGQTNSMIGVMKRGKQHGATVVALTSRADSQIGRGSDFTVRIKGKTAKDLAGSGLKVPLGTPFELTTMVFLDSVIEELVHRHGKSAAELRAHHANLE